MMLSSPDKKSSILNKGSAAHDSKTGLFISPVVFLYFYAFFHLFSIPGLIFSKMGVNCRSYTSLFDNSSGEMPEWPKGTVC